MKKAFLLLHWWWNTPIGDKSAFFPDLQKKLESNGYLVLAPHLPYAEWRSFEKTSKSIDEILKQLEGYKLSILWHSSGAYLACHLAAKYNIEKLILIAPTCPLPYFSSELHSLIRKWFDADWVCHYQAFHHHLFDIQKLITHVNHLQIYFGHKDPYINQEIRQWYAKEFAHAPSLEFHTLRNRGHMWVDEWVVELPEIFNSIY